MDSRPLLLSIVALASSALWLAQAPTPALQPARVVGAANLSRVGVVGDRLVLVDADEQRWWLEGEGEELRLRAAADLQLGPGQGAAMPLLAPSEGPLTVEEDGRWLLACPTSELSALGQTAEAVYLLERSGAVLRFAGGRLDPLHSARWRPDLPAIESLAVTREAAWLLGVDGDLWRLDEAAGAIERVAEGRRVLQVVADGDTAFLLDVEGRVLEGGPGGWRERGGPGDVAELALSERYLFARTDAGAVHALDRGRGTWGLRFTVPGARRLAVTSQRVALLDGDGQLWTTRTEGALEGISGWLFPCRDAEGEDPR